MRQSFGAAILVLAAFSGCGDDGRIPGDAGADGDTSVDGGGDGGDVCDGVTTCATSGAICDRESLVVCAPDADGCLVETRTDCAAGGSSCSAAGGIAECVADPCASVPVEMRCDAESRACDGDGLVVCAADAMGCLVETRTDCASSPGGVCDETGAMPLCLLPTDPCEAIPAAERCATAGTSCVDATSLEVCAPDAFGCLVRSATDCSERAGGICDPTVPAACAFTGDPCDGVTECATPGAVSCDGPDLVECRRDGFGCYVEVRTSCTDAPFGFCDADATPRPSCGTAATDPCMGMAACTPLGSACDGDTLRVCATNAFGCDVEVATMCDVTGDVCDDTTGTPLCVDPCSLVDLCPAAGYCDGIDAVACAPDADGCLVEATREVCTGLCDVPMATGVAECVADTLCPEAERTILDCASGTVSSTTVGGTTALGTYPTECTTFSEYDGPERIFRFQNTGVEDVAVTITTSSTMTADHDLFVLEADFTSRSCTADLVCLDGSTAGGPTESVAFRAMPGELRYVVFDDFGTLPASPIPFDLTVTCTPLVCGDGVVATAEGCDDGNTTDGDGCSSTCDVEGGFACSGAPSTCMNVCGNSTIDPSEGCDDGDMMGGDGCSATCGIEAGYVCSGEPSVCLMAAANGTCATAAALTPPVTVMGNTIAGGAQPTGAGCPPGGPGGGGNTLYYAVDVAPGDTIAAEVTPDMWDAVLVRLAGCASGCAASVDGPGASPELLTYTNAGATSETVTFAVFPFGASSGGDFDLNVAVATCGDGVVAPGEACDDGDVMSGDGCSSLCVPELGYECTGAPSMCTRLYTVTTRTAACVSMASGTDVMALGDDQASPIAALPFAFSYFGSPVTHYSVTSNGYIQLWPSSAGTPSTTFRNGSIPDAATPNGMVAAFWDDLNTTTGTTLRSRVVGTSPNRRFVVEWGGWTPFGVSADSLRFQIWLREGSSVIELHYCDLTGSSRVNGESATIGIENLDGTGAAEVSFDTPGAVMTGSGYRFTP